MWKFSLNKFTPTHMYTNDHFISPLFLWNRISLAPLANPLTLLFKREGRPASGYKDPSPRKETRQSYELLYSPWEQRTSICVEVVLLLRHRRERCQCHRSVVSALNGAGASVVVRLHFYANGCRLYALRCVVGFMEPHRLRGNRKLAEPQHIVSSNHCNTLYGRFFS